MRLQEVSVVSLHPDPSDPLGLDLKHILSAFEPKLADWAWCVKNLDWLGENGESLCEAVETAGPEGFWIDSQDLVKEVGGIYQTIEGEFMAFPRSIDRRDLESLDLDLSSFPASRAVVGVVAVDGCYFDVYSKDSEALKMLHAKFPDAKNENPDLYF
jgi:hypothetical protein